MVFTYFSVVGNSEVAPRDSQVCCKPTFSHLFNQTGAAVKGFCRRNLSPKLLD